MQGALGRTEYLFRLAMPGLLGLGLCGFVYVTSQLAPSPMTPWAIAVIVSQVYVVCEICRAVLAAFDRRFGWHRGVGVRLAAQLGLSALIACAYALAVYVPVKGWLIAQGERDAIGWPHLSLIGMVALGVALFAGLVQFCLRFFAHWRESENAAQALQRETLRARVEALQAQVNPHFLFNSLNALYGTIAEDPSAAQKLVLKLAEVFRYALRHSDAPVVGLDDELAFLAAYLDLLKARHAQALDVTFQLGGDESSFALPPLTLQLLVENAVKHNSLDGPGGLPIRIERTGERLVVSHPRRPRRDAAAGAGTGLANIRRRYALLDAGDIAIVDDARQFSVSLPLIRRT